MGYGIQWGSANRITRVWASCRWGTGAVIQGDSLMTDRRVQLRAAAISVFSEKGYRAATMQDISEKVGLSKPTLYHYVRTKEELLIQVYEDVLAVQLEQDQDIVSEKSSPEATIAAILEARVLYGCEHAELYRIFFEEEAELPADLMHTVAGQRRIREDVLKELVEAGIADGSFHVHLSPRLAARTMIGATILVYKWYRTDGAKSADVIAKEISSYLLSALKGGPGAPAVRDRGLDGEGE
jgi:AcrR family transcriptional regulator